MPEHSVRSASVCLALILLAAFTIRLAWVLVVQSDPRFDFQFDANFYQQAARGLLAGEGYRWYRAQPTAYLPPGYPVVLASVYAVFGENPFVGKLLNVVLATLTCFLVHRVAKHAYGEGVALPAAALFAVCPGDVFASALLLSEVVFGCALMGILLAFLRWSGEPGASGSWRWLLFGVLLGLASLVRGVALLLLTVFIVVWVLELGWRRPVFRRALLATLGLVLAILPWVVRNAVTMGAPILISADGAYVLFQGHSPIADGTQSFRGSRLRDELFPEYAKLPRPHKEVTMSRAQIAYALRYWATHPKHELSLVPRRLFHLFAHDHWALDQLRRKVPDPATGATRHEVVGAAWDHRFARVADVYFYALLTLALAGLVLSLTSWRPRRWLLPLAFAYFQVLHGVIFIGAARFHAPLVPILAVLASVAVAGVMRRRAQNALHPVGA